MRITFISNLFPDSDELYRGQDNANLLHAFPPEYDFRVLSPRPNLRIFNNEVRSCREIDQRYSPVYLDYFYVPKFGTLFNHIFYNLSLRNYFFKHASEFLPDVIIVSWAYPDAVSVIMYANECGVPVVVITQGSDVHIYMTMPLRSLIIAKAMLSANAIITRSAKLAQILSDTSSALQSVKPIYNGVHQHIFTHCNKLEALKKAGLQASEKHLLYVGNFYQVKNPELLLKALEIVKNSFPKIGLQLHLIGEGYLKDKLHHLASELNLVENVHFHGRKTSVEIATYMQACDLLCIPSFNEGLPNVLLEALSCGLPVVSTDVGGISEVLHDERFGTLVSTFDPSDYANAINHRLNLTEDRMQIIDYSKRFSWENTVQSYINVLDDVVEGR